MPESERNLLALQPVQDANPSASAYLPPGHTKQCEGEIIPYLTRKGMSPRTRCFQQNDLVSNRVSHYKTQFSDVKDLQMMVSKNNYIALLLNNKPRLLQLPKI